jgi:signal transduction histidine kinase
LLGLLCLLLTALQYRWTGEISRAEAARLRLTLGESAQAMVNALDAELTGACLALTPSRTQLQELSPAAAFAARYRDWRATDPRPLFRRVAVAIPSNGAVELVVGDPKSGGTTPGEWTADWQPFREFVTRMADGGRPGLEDRSGEFLEFPLFGGRSGGGPGGSTRGWLLVQLDLAFIKSTWLPELIRSYLKVDDTLPYDVTVTETSSNRMLFRASEDPRPAGEVLFSARFLRDGPMTLGPRGGPGGEPSGRRSGRDGGLWSLQVYQRPGALEALVTSSRRRNLAVAVVMNALILAASVALVVHTRRSRRLAEARMNFVATVSHELRTPLTVIRGAGHNLLRGVVKDREQIQEYSKLILQHADQLSEMVEQTLALASTQQGRPDSKREPVNLVEVLKDAVAAAAEETRAAGCTVELEVSPDLPPVAGDPAALRRVFQNLVANAAKHGGAGGWIGIRAMPMGAEGRKMVEVRVADRGPGIPKNERSEIFKPFVRGAAAQAAQTRGSGLGLSLVKESVESHGGTVALESELGAGATFVVRLPARLRSPAP